MGKFWRCPMKSKISKYQRNRVEKLEAIATGISIERRHKVFLDSNGLNLSAIVRDALDALMEPKDSPIEAQARKLVEVFLKGKETPDRELERLAKLIEEEN